MPNQWFRFKHFTIHQQHAAMKVTTDACLLGALQPVFPNDGAGKRILDIGAGTGLLSLMVAQLNPLAKITGVEIDPETASEARSNAEASPFANVEIIEGDILDFNHVKPFDHIVTNPPFYESQLASEDNRKNLALHSTSLRLEQLLEVINRLLHPEGSASVLIPHYREAEARHHGRANDLFPEKSLLIRQTPNHSYFRNIMFFSRKTVDTIMEECTIKGHNGEYSQEFTQWLKPFYLYL